MARFALNVWLQRDIAFPWGTLSANLFGCLVMGAIAQLVASAARSLGSIGSPDSVEPLMKLTKDSRATVRVAAVEALSELPLKG